MIAPGITPLQSYLAILIPIIDPLLGSVHHLGRQVQPIEDTAGLLELLRREMEFGLRKSGAAPDAACLQRHFRGALGGVVHELQELILEDVVIAILVILAQILGMGIQERLKLPELRLIELGTKLYLELVHLFGSPDGIRTRVFAVKGRRPGPG